MALNFVRLSFSFNDSMVLLGFNPFTQALIDQSCGTEGVVSFFLEPGYKFLEQFNAFLLSHKRVFSLRMYFDFNSLKKISTSSLKDLKEFLVKRKY